MMDRPSDRAACTQAAAGRRGRHSQDADATATSSLAAFQALRSELVRKWQEVSGRHFAYSILKEENNNQVAFKRLLSEEQQAERT